MFALVHSMRVVDTIFLLFLQCVNCLH